MLRVDSLFLKLCKCLCLCPRKPQTEVFYWSWAEAKETQNQTEENISHLTARSVNRSWLRPHGVPISDSMTDYSSSSERYLSRDSYLELPTFLTLYQASDRIWWLLQMSRDFQQWPWISRKVKKTKTTKQTKEEEEKKTNDGILMSPPLRVKRSKINFGPAMLSLSFSF